MKKASRRIVFAAIAALAPVAPAWSDPVVVELFTSAGCSSCPQADELLRQLAKEQEVLPLALHVDYWDYLGWKDEFASGDFTKRQYAYAKAMGKHMVYTPQMVIGGSDETIGSDSMKVTSLIRKHMSRPHVADISVTREGSVLTVLVQPVEGARAERSSVQLIRFHPGQTVDVKRGENAGRSIHYVNIVTEWREIGRWDGRSATKITEPIEGNMPVAIVIQERDQGEILASASLR